MDLYDFDLKQLRSFVVLSEELHFHRAAERLHIAQPALTRQIKQLEEGLGIQLFHRNSKGTKLTPAGEIMFLHTRRILAELRDLVSRVDDPDLHLTGNLRVGFCTTFIPDFLPRVLSEFARQFPQVTLDLQEGGTEGLSRLLQEQHVDVAFLHPPIDSHYLDVVDLFKKPMIAAVPDDMIFSRKRMLQLSECAETNIILFNRTDGPYLYDGIIEAFRSSGVEPRIYQRVGSSLSRLGLVSSGMGITFVPRSVRHISVPNVRYLHVDEKMPQMSFGYATIADFDNPVKQEFLKVISKIANEQVRAVP